MRQTVAVVGCGIVGASTALALAQRGHRVVVFDPRPPGHTMGSSHGRSRIIRKTYPDAFYTEVLLDAYPLWAELQEATGRSLFNECGLLYVGRGDAPEIRDAIRALEQNRVPFRPLDGRSIGKVSPIQLEVGEIALHTKDGGAIDADAAWLAVWGMAESLGASRRTMEVASLEELGAGWDRVILAPGPWIRRFVPLDVIVSLQAVAYFEGTVFGPVWIEASPLHPYGFPSEPGAGTFKVAMHFPGPEMDPSKPSRTPPKGMVDMAREAAGRRFGIAEPKLVESLGCLYTNTDDEGFRIGSVGENGLYVSACSGHGFKFALWIGRVMADLVDGKRQVDGLGRLRGPDFALGSVAEAVDG